MREGGPDNRPHNLQLRQTEERKRQAEGGGKQDERMANKQTGPNKKALQGIFKIYKFSII